MVVKSVARVARIAECQLLWTYRPDSCFRDAVRPGGLARGGDI